MNNDAVHVLKRSTNDQDQVDCGSTGDDGFGTGWHSPGIPRRSHKPPMNVVVIKGTPDSGVASSGSLFTSPSLSQYNDEPSQRPIRPRSFAQATSSPFKLMPRKSVPVWCSPSPSSRGRAVSRGRKRRAHSISSPSSTRSAETEASRDEQGDALDTQPATAAAGRRSSATDLLTMRSLSLQSPVGRKSLIAEDPRSPPVLPPQHLGASSFSIYSGASPGSVNQIGCGSIAGSTGSVIAARTPCSSAKSSPRQVPLTVISHGQIGPSPTRSVNGRPPFHAGTSSLMQSLHGRVDDDDDLATPTRLASSFDTACTPKDRPIDHLDIRSTHRCSYSTDGASIGMRSCVSGLSPRTPLPKVTLTPKTPLSARRNKNMPLPIFPSPADDGIDINTTPVGRSIMMGQPSPWSQSSPWSSHEGGHHDMGMMMDSLLGSFPNKASRSSGSQTRAQSLPFMSLDRPTSHSERRRDRNDASRTGSKVDSPNSPNRKPGFLPMATFEDSPEATSQAVQSRTPQRTNRRSSESESVGTAIPILTKSVLTPSQSNSYFDEMMRVEARGGVMDAETGSLSDSDEEFVLAAPGALSQKRMELSAVDDNLRARQRRRRSHDKLSSAASVASNKASNNSLFGMDIVHEENQSLGSSGQQRASTPFSLGRVRKGGSASPLSISRKSHGSTGDLGYSLARGKSENSLGSIGLCLESSASSDTRDLVTPPVTIPSALSPPPLPQANGVINEKSNGSSQLCVSAADHRSVSLAIARMASTDPYGSAGPA